MVIRGYDRINWEDLPSQNTPINAENLNHMEDGIERLYGAIGDIDLDAIADDIAEVKEEVENFQPGVELTQEEYDSLSEEEKNNGTIYYIKDGDASAITAADAHYDNSTSGLNATDVQGAVDELNANSITVYDKGTTADGLKWIKYSNGVCMAFKTDTFTPASTWTVLNPSYGDLFNSTPAVSVSAAQPGSAANIVGHTMVSETGVNIYLENGSGYDITYSLFIYGYWK